MPEIVLAAPPEVEVRLQLVKLQGQLPGGTLTLFPLPSADDHDARLDALMGVEEVAEIIGFSSNHLRNTIHTLLPSVRIGSRVLYRLSDVVKLIESSTHPVGHRRKRKAKAA